MIREFYSSLRSDLPLFPLIPHRCRFFSTNCVKKKERKRGTGDGEREQLNFDSPAIRVSLEGAYFIHFEAGNFRVVASKFRERKREKEARKMRRSTTGRSLISNERAQRPANDDDDEDEDDD